MIARNTDIINANHGTKNGELMRRQEPICNNIIIGNDVWVGGYVGILPGVHIGTGSVIGMNSTVTKDIPNYSIAVGSPAKVTRSRISNK